MKNSPKSIESESPRTRIHGAKICVYRHIIDGVVFYVGKGVGGRAFHERRRNPRWRRLVKAAGHFDVEIVAWCETDKQARWLEGHEIARLKPAANRLTFTLLADGTVRQNGNGKRSRKISPPMPAEVDQSEAA